MLFFFLLFYNTRVVSCDTQTHQLLVCIRRCLLFLFSFALSKTWQHRIRNVFFLVLLLVAIPYKTDTGENVVARPTQKNFGCVDVCVLVIVCSLYVFHGCKSVVRHQQRCNRNIQSNPFENIHFGRIDEWKLGKIKFKCFWSVFWNENLILEIKLQLRRNIPPFWIEFCFSKPSLALYVRMFIALCAPSMISNSNSVNQ